MIEERYQNVLDSINLTPEKKDMIVLAAILKRQEKPTDFVDFEEIREQLVIDEGRRKGKDSLIYRSLSWLETAGLIQVDRSEHKHGYNSNVGLMHKVFRRIIKDKISEIDNELRLIDSEIEELSRLDEDNLASELLSLVAGKKQIARPAFAVGWENVLQLIDDKIYNNLKRGDFVRFCVEWLSRADVINPIRVERIEKLLKKGVKFHVLEHNKISQEKRKTFKQLTMTFIEKGYTPKFRVYKRQDSTYQFLGRNDEGIVLIVSENPFSATWIPRESNRDLVDNAIQTFDADFAAGISLIEEGE
jgi:hypothetical protein